MIQQIAVEHRRRYGYRRISAELRRRGLLVNPKRVLRIIREDNLLAMQTPAFVPDYGFRSRFRGLSNLASRLKLTWHESALGSRHHLYPSEKAFVFLAVVLDAFSRKVVGWALDRTLASRLPIAALEQAIAQRQPPARFGASFRPWRAVRFRRLRADLAEAPDDSEHESAGEPL